MLYINMHIGFFFWYQYFVSIYPLIQSWNVSKIPLEVFSTHIGRKKNSRKSPFIQCITICNCSQTDRSIEHQ